MSDMSAVARIASTVACAIALLATAAPANSATPQTNLADIEDEVMCTICGTTLELSEAPQADRERALIRRLVDQGLTKDEIKDRLVAEYGEEVLAIPDDEGFDLLAWLIPGVGIAVALAAIALVISRRRRIGSLETTPPELDSGDLTKLDRDMSSYDL